MDNTTGAAPAPRSNGAGGGLIRPEYAPAPAFDAGRYWSYLESLDSTAAEKTALLQTLWDLMSGFVQLGFGVDPVQTLIPALIQASMTEEREDGVARQSFNGSASDTRGEGDTNA